MLEQINAILGDKTHNLRSQVKTLYPQNENCQEIAKPYSSLQGVNNLISNDFEPSP